MHFGVDSGSLLSGGGLVVVLILGAWGLSVWRYNSIDRPEEEREIAETREAAAREQQAIHDQDVPQ